MMMQTLNSQKTMTLLAGTLFLATALPIFGAKPAPFYPMRVEFFDAGQNLRSDSGGPYIHGQKEVLAELRSAGQLQMTTCYQAPNTGDVNCQRFLYLDLRDPVSVPSIPAYGRPEGSYGDDENLVPYPTTISVFPIDDDGSDLPDGLRAIMSPGEVRLGRLVINVYATSSVTGTDVQYTVRFKPFGPGGSLDFAWPDSSFVRIAYKGGKLDCSGVASEGLNGCAAWEISAEDSDANRYNTTTVGTLVSDNLNDEGDYRLPLRFLISVQPPPDGGSGGGGKGGGPKK